MNKMNSTFDANSWSCLPCSFAKVLGTPVKRLIQLIGHDGSDEPYEDMPGQKAGFHEQECIEVLQQLGYACTPIEIVPQMMPTLGGPIRSIWFFPEKLTADPEDWNWQRLLRHLKGTHGVITGVKKRLNGKMAGHAVAWCDGKIYDSQGYGFVYDLENMHSYGFIPRTYWKVQEIM